MDFGLALLAEGSRLTQLDSRLGTVAYMSPEQAQGAEVDGRTDIWALGCVFYEMVCGQRPFKGQYDPALIYEIVQEEPGPLTGIRTGVPMELDWIAGKCLAKDSGERYQSAAEVLVDLSTQQKKIQSGKSAVRKPASSQVLSAPVPAAKPRHAKAVALGVAGLLVVASAAFFVGTRFGEEIPAIPTYKRLTFRRGTITSARFAPDGNTIVYSAAWDNGGRQLYSTRPEGSESRSLNIQDVDIFAISKTGEMALAQRPPRFLGASFDTPNTSYQTTLLQASLSGGAPREVLEDVLHADWTPGGELSVVRKIAGRARIESPVGKVLYETPDRIANFRISPKDGKIAFSERSVGFSGSWQLVTIDTRGEKTISTPSASGDNLILAWSPNSQALWFDIGFVGGQTIRELSPSGAERVVLRVPVNLRLLDVSPGGRALVSRANWRTGINCLTAGETAERDLSWYDASEVDALSPDGRTILFTEFGEGGGIEHWGVYLRKASGEPAVRLGDGQAFALSPDGNTALTMRLGIRPEIVLLPTGAGEPVHIKNDAIRNYTAMDWMPDGRQIVFAGSAAGEGVRCYVQDIHGGEPTPITPVGFGFGLGQRALSPDGEWIAAQADAAPSLFPTRGGEGRLIPGSGPDDKFLAWSADGRSIFVRAKPEIPGEIYKVDLSTGQRTFWKALAPADPVGVFDVYGIQISADEQSYCYSYSRNISDLYLVESLR
jgi:Tol biopolymer transport system component